MPRSLQQYIENEDFDPFLYNALEINLRSLKPELEDFYENLEKLFIQLFKLLKYNGVFINDLYKLEKTFFKDLKKQFAKLIILDGKYSSGHFTKIENIFLKEFINKKNFIIKIFFNIKLFLLLRKFLTKKFFSTANGFCKKNFR